MIHLTTLAAFALNAAAIIIFSIVFIWCWVKRADIKAVKMTALIIIVFYCLSHLINARLAYLTNSIDTYYLYWAGVTGILIAVIIALHEYFRYYYYLTIKVILALLTIDLILNCAVHIDRNILALNGNASPNIDIQSRWLLWDIRNIQSTISNVAIAICLITRIDIGFKARKWLKNF